MSLFGRPPSTPGRSIHTHQSTTPAGPPPTWLENTGKSTTPAGEPPRSSRFGRSSYNPTKSPNRFARRKPDFAVPDDDDDDDLYSDEDAMGEHNTDNEYLFQQSEWEGRPPRPSAPTPPRGLKRDAYGAVRENSGIADIARSRTSNSQPAPLNEPDAVILQSERIVSELDVKIQRRVVEGEAALVETAADLTKTWKQHSELATKTGAIGPKSKDSFTKANYLASLLIQLHHPHTNSPQQLPGRLRNGSVPLPTRSLPVPRALLDWLETYHRPFPDDFDTIHLNEPSPAAHESFWDVVFANLLRGHTGRVIRLLKDAGWEHADSAIDDGASEPGYHGRQLDNVIAVIQDCIRVLDECPGSRYNNWDVKSMEWAVFRQRVRSSLDELEDFAEGDDMNESLNGENVFQRSLGSSMNMSTASRKASSRVPWTIYENLRLLYGLVLGQPDQILMTAQEWLEGALYLTIWWDGSDESDLDASANQNPVKRAQDRTREVDVAPLASYRRRLADAYLRVQDQLIEDDRGRQVPDSVFQPDTIDDVQLGLGCIMEDQVSSVIRILRTLSMPIAVSVVEIAALGGWLPLSRPSSRGGALGQGGFSKEDLLVLSYGAPRENKEDVDRDQILLEYADLLSGKEKIGEKEGWELAVSLLNRLDQTATANTKIGELLDRLQLTNEDTVDKVLDVCDELGQTEQRRSIAERYADNLAENTQSYGPALIYYARAHAKEKLKDTVSLLTSLTLLHSASMPNAKTIDAKLESLISKDRAALKTLGRADMGAAQLLASHLSGYATLRKFYDLRDQDIITTSERPLKPLERRRQAAASLFAVLKSAADCIPGGLFDPEAETVIPVEGLLALFGEALPFLGHEKRIFTQQQIFALLGILEGFVAAPSRIRENAESLLSASLGAYRDENNTGTGPFGKKGKGKNNAKEDMSKSVGSSWELLADSVFIDPQKGEKIERAWDWRQGLVNGGIEGKEQEVVKLVREALVREVASGWGGKVIW